MSVANPLTPNDIGVFIFAKAPVPGYCKTRLARGCNAVRAARLYRAMLERTVAAACRQQPGTVTLVCAPDTRHPLFARLARRYSLARRRQARGDLGERMHAALSAGLRRHRMVVLMGSDQPALSDNWLAHAARSLDTHPSAWVAPTFDGGYWAIGMTRAEARVFRGPAWSSCRVARQTRQRIQRCGLSDATFPERADVDTWRDWLSLQAPERSSIVRAAVMPGIRRFTPPSER